MISKDYWKDYYWEYGFTDRESAMAKTIDELMVTLNIYRPGIITSDRLCAVGLSLLADFIEDHREHPGHIHRTHRDGE